MKIITLIILTFTPVAYGQVPCAGQDGYFHRNQDGSIGGFIQKTAVVSQLTYLDSSSEICGKVKITGSPRIESGSRIEGEVLIEGAPVIRNSHIFGYAKISGGTIITGSTVCQGSEISGIRVVNSQYYCQTEDPEPKDPGEAGMRTLLGMDTDGDGVRDDIEIYINKSLSNTPVKNLKEERETTKVLAKILQKELLLRSSSKQIENLFELKNELYNCFDLKLADDLLVEMYNTEERLLAKFKVAGYLHGKEIPAPSQKCDLKLINSAIVRIK